MGVYDSPPPEGGPLLKSVNVGGGLAGKAAKFANDLAADAAAILDKIPFIG